MLGTCTLCKGEVMIRWLGRLGRYVGTNNFATIFPFVVVAFWDCFYNALKLHLHMHHYIVVVTCVIVPFSSPVRLLRFSIDPVGSYAPY